MAGLLGKKIRMTQIFDKSGLAIPVTLISAGPCFVTQVKTIETDGYDAVQLGYVDLKEKHTTKPRVGHCKKGNLKPLKYLHEFKPFGKQELKVGDEVRVDIFSEGQLVDVSSRSKGKGFQGVMKRHGFQGANITHGQSDRQRAPGSLGQSSYPSRVYKGIHMAGRMGNTTVSVQNLEIIKIDLENNLLFIKGAVPGAPNSLVEINTNK
jgi:large subunit ribosomal protein L3